MAGAGLLLDVPLHHDEEERSVGAHSAPEDKRSRTPMSEKKQKAWYYASMYPSYKTRKQEFKSLFPDCHRFKFVVDYSCAYHKDILHQGRLFVTSTAACFYSYIFGWEQKLILDWKDVTTITKEKTAIFIPNAIQITTENQKFFFASFVDRESSYLMLVKFWQAATSDQWLPDEDIDQIIALNYGEGDEEDEEDAAAPSSGPTLPRPRVHQVDNQEQVPPDTCKREDLSEEVQTVFDRWMQQCGGSIVCDKTLNRPLEELYSLLYSNSNFFFTFHKDRGTTELEIGDWEDDDEGSGGKIREVSYNMSLNNPVGPKKCQVKETQRMRSEGVVEGKVYCIETEADNSGVPYADSFTVVTNGCLLALGNGQARFIAKAEITFKKDLWSFLKDKIEANAWSGITSYYSSLALALESYSSLEPEQARASRGDARGRQAGAIQCREVNKVVAQETGLRTRDLLVGILVMTLLLVSLLNTLALHRLSNMADTSQSSPAPAPPPPLHLEDLGSPSQRSDWAALVEKQAEFYNRRSTWLKQRLRAASELLSKAERELEILGAEVADWQAVDWRTGPGNGGTNCDRNNDDDSSIDSCDKPDAVLHN